MRPRLLQAAGNSRASSLPQQHAADGSRASSLPHQLLRKLVVSLAGSFIIAPSVLYGQVVSGPDAQARPVVVDRTQASTIVVAKRLSDWLLEQPILPDDYPLGLSWRVPGEVAPQGELRLDLLRRLSGLDREVKADREAIGRPHDWVRTLPVTGRVPVAVTDARWLQANPARDPALQPGHSVVLPKRPRTVTVVTTRGERCLVAHAPGHEAMAYVETCGAGSHGADWAWVAQPDGRVQRFGVAAWNREAQDEPAPGAWIWAPPRDGRWPEHLSQRLIAFLATQGPAADSQSFASKLAPTNLGLTNPDLAAESRANAPQPAPGGVSGAWKASGLPELGRADQREPMPRTGTGTSDSAVTAVLPAPGPAVSARSRSLVTTASDWGGVGLLQTPTARMEKAGHLTVNFSRMYPYFQGNIMDE